MSTSVNSKVSGIATGDVLSDGSVPYTGTLYGANGISTFVSIYPGSNSPVGLAGSANNGLLFLGDDGGGMRTHVKIAKYSNVILANDYGLSWASTNDAYAGSIDLTIIRDAANILAQRNSTNAQTFRVYNTRTDASNYERGFMRWASNVLEIGAEAAGTGTARAVKLMRLKGTTGEGSAALGANSPATANTEPYTWVEITSADGSTCYIPAFK